MRVGRNFRNLVVALVAGVGALPVGQLYAASGEDVIKSRVTYMRDELQGQWKVLAAFGKAGTGSLAEVEKSAATLVELSKKLPGHFPKDTGRGNFPDKLTTALPAIWTDAAEFQKATQNFATETAKLVTLAKAGNKDAVVDMIGNTGSYNRTKIGCGECHQKFRGPTVRD